VKLVKSRFKIFFCASFVVYFFELIALCVRNDYLYDIIRWLCNPLCTASEISDNYLFLAQKYIF